MGSIVSAGARSAPGEDRQLASGVTESLIRVSQLLSQPFNRWVVDTKSITLTEWRVLVRIHRSPGIAAQEIATRTGISPMNVSRALASLRRSGRVAVDRDPDDSRRNLLRLTSSGEALFDELYPDAAARSARMYESLSEEELRVLDGLLRRIGDHIQQVDQAEGAND